MPPWITCTTNHLMDIWKKTVLLKFLMGLDRLPHLNLNLIFQILITLKILFATFPNFWNIYSRSRLSIYSNSHTSASYNLPVHFSLFLMHQKTVIINDDIIAWKLKVRLFLPPFKKIFLLSSHTSIIWIRATPFDYRQVAWFQLH